MSELKSQVDYHASRALQEFDCADRARVDAERSLHLELGRLHLKMGGWLQTEHSNLHSGTVVPIKRLDMGEASREEGFRQNGSR